MKLIKLSYDAIKSYTISLLISSKYTKEDILQIACNHLKHPDDVITYKELEILPAKHPNITYYIMQFGKVIARTGEYPGLVIGYNIVINVDVDEVDGELIKKRV